jgi:SAM-dependent methyltransferase
MTLSMTISDPKNRFSNRVDDYVRYRPGYPREVLDLLRAECGLTSESVVADLGSGTGILTKLFLENANRVYGIEPNAAMRAAGEQFLKEYPRFQSVSGSAEATTLPDAVADLAVAGQAFHWFELELARKEMLRLLKPGGWMAILWNERKHDASLLLREYENLLRAYGTDYGQVSDRYPDKARLEKFFGPGVWHETFFANEQLFDFEGLRGRLLSSSYAPVKGHANYEPMLAELAKMFERHARDGRVRFELETRVYYGQLRR